MEKQEAVDFVLERLAHDYSQAEIVRDLTHRLDAPVPIAALKAFVAKVEAEHPHIRPEPLSKPAAAPPSASDTALPSAFLVDTFEQGQPNIEIPSSPARSDELSLPPPATRATIAPPASSPEPEELPNPEAGVAQSPHSALKVEILEDQELKRLILNLLKKGRKRSDITVLVCERAGMEWSQAQRLVAQIEVENYKGLSARQNVPAMALGILGALAGMATLFFGFAGLAPYLIVYLNMQINLPIYVSMTPDAALGVLVTGFGLLVGGIVGVVWAIQSQASA